MALNFLPRSDHAAGNLPTPLKMEDILDRQRLKDVADVIYKHNINVVALVETTGKPVVVKSFGWRQRYGFWISPMRPARAITSWTIAQTLIRLKARTPEPLYVFTRRRWGFIHENIYICEAIKPHKTLRAFLKSDVSGKEKGQAIADVARSLANMHRGGVLHRDLTTANFLVAEDRRVYLVDLNRSKMHPELTRKQRLRDLARMQFATGDKEINLALRRIFFREYAGEYEDAEDWNRAYTRARRWRLMRKRLREKLRRRNPE